MTTRLEQRLAAPTISGGYKPSVMSSGYVLGRNRPTFTWGQVEEMRIDPGVQFCLDVMAAPISRARWQVRCESREVARFIDGQIRKIWQQDLPKLLANLEYGACGGETLYECGSYWEVKGLADMVPGDLRPMVHERELVAVKVNNTAEGTSLLPPARFWWVANRPRFGSPWGRSQLASAWVPWWEKHGPKGACDSRRTWYFKNSYSGGTIRHPNGVVDLGDGVTMSNQDYARELLEKFETGGILALPNSRDETGEYEWVYEPPQLNGDASGLLEYPRNLDDEITEGMGVPVEVRRASEVGSGWSGRSVPFLVFLSSMDRTVSAILSAIDKHIIRYLVLVNFGQVKYAVAPISLVPKDQPASQQPGKSQQPNASPPPVSLSAQHAPTGGVTVQGVKYKGGEFIPSEVMAKATDAEKAAVSGGGGKQSPRSTAARDAHAKAVSEWRERGRSREASRQHLGKVVASGHDDWHTKDSELHGKLLKIDPLGPSLLEVKKAYNSVVNDYHKHWDEVDAALRDGGANRSQFVAVRVKAGGVMGAAAKKWASLADTHAIAAKAHDDLIKSEPDGFDEAEWEKQNPEPEEPQEPDEPAEETPEAMYQYRESQADYRLAMAEWKKSHAAWEKAKSQAEKDLAKAQARWESEAEKSSTALEKSQDKVSDSWETLREAVDEQNSLIADAAAEALAEAHDSLDQADSDDDEPEPPDEDEDSDEGEEPVSLSVHRAPVGGVTVQGTHYTGGQFIPAEVMDRATTAERAAVEKGGQAKAPPQSAAQPGDLQSLGQALQKEATAEWSALTGRLGDLQTSMFGGQSDPDAASGQAKSLVQASVRSIHKQIDAYAGRGMAALRQQHGGILDSDQAADARGELANILDTAKADIADAAEGLVGLFDDVGDLGSDDRQSALIERLAESADDYQYALLSATDDVRDGFTALETSMEEIAESMEADWEEEASTAATSLNQDYEEPAGQDATADAAAVNQDFEASGNLYRVWYDVEAGEWVYGYADDVESWPGKKPDKALSLAFKRQCRKARRRTRGKPARPVKLSRSSGDPADALIDKAVSAGVAISEETRARVRELLKKK